MSQPIFITFEGVEGSGKTTQVALLVNALREMGYDVVTAKEPSGTPLGDELRHLLLNTDIPTNPLAQLYLFSASRAQLLADVVLPALERNAIVILDRYTDSTLAYQCFGFQLPMDTVISTIHTSVRGVPEPSLTFWMDIRPDKSLARKSGAAEINNFDKFDIEFHNRVYSGYEYLCRYHKSRIARIDATAPEAVIHQQIADLFMSLMQKKG